MARNRVKGVLLALVGTTILVAPVGGDEDLATELPRIPAQEPAEAGMTFRIHPGFRLELVAAEPRVADPVAACYDAEGRLYVVEMRGYPYPENVPSGNVSRLEDVDGDGRFDRRSIFLDGLSWPTSVVPHDGGVFIAVAPEILYAKDTDGDGKADLRRTVFKGFGTQNVQALLNGLLAGPDGWIYGVGGGNGGDILPGSRPDAPPVSIRGRDFRFKPDGSAFEAVSGGGQFGHSFDDWGHRFTCNNSNSIRQIILPARYLERNPRGRYPSVVTDIAVEGGAGPVFRISRPEPWRVVRTRQRLADPTIATRLAPTEKFAFGFFTSATGVTIYRGTAFPPPFRGNAFIGDVGGNLVHRDTMERTGSIYRARRADEGVEFLASTDNWFRPVNFVNTPNGTLLVLDMYRETIEHPESIPEPIKRHLDLTSGHDRGRLYEILPQGFTRNPRPFPGTSTTPELVALLAHPDAWWRETASRLLRERAEPASAGGLRRLAGNAPSPQSRFHALTTLDALGWLAPAEILPAMTDPEPAIRETAARLSERFLNDSAPLQAGITALADDPDPMVRFQAALSVGEWEHGPVAAVLARIARRDLDDPWTRAAVLSSAQGRGADLLALLIADPPFPATGGGPALAEALASQVGSEAVGDSVNQVIDWAAGDTTPPALAGALLNGLGEGLRRRGSSLREAAAGPKLTRLLVQAAVLASAETASGADRVGAVRMISLGPVDPAIEVLTPLIGPRQPADVQLAAISSLSSLPDERVGAILVERWKSLGPAIRREALDALVARPGRALTLLRAVADGSIAASDLDPVRRQLLLNHSDAEVRAQAAEVLGPSPRGDRGVIVSRYQPAVSAPADADRGRAVFERVCATCHRANGKGHAVGPAMETVAGRGAVDLLLHILDPNREVAPAFISYTVATTDGRLLTGMIAEESGTSLTLKRAEGAQDVVDRDQVEEIRSTGLSLMPENLETLVDPPMMADLIAYLRNLQPGG